MVKKIENKFNDPKIGRANVILGKIQFIICKNNPNGGADPDAMENDDKKVFVNPKRSVNPKDVKREMINLLELFTQLRDVVENIEDIGKRTEFGDIINKLDRVRQDIRDENQDMINDKVPFEDRLPVAQDTFLEIKGGDTGVFKDWT